MSSETQSDTGFFSKARHAAACAVDLLRNRTDLASVELEEERLRLIDLLIRAAVVCVLGLLTLASGTALIVVLLWDYSPVLSLAGITLLYAAATLLAATRLRASVQESPAPFTDTRAALESDARWLRGNHDRTPDA